MEKNITYDKIARARSILNSIGDTVKDVSVEPTHVTIVVCSTAPQIHPSLGVFNAALQRFTDVSGFKVDFSSLILDKACEKRQETLEASVDLTEKLDALLSITDRVSVFKERQESRRILESMLQLIAEITDYIRNHTETVFGLSPFPLLMDHRSAKL